MPGAAFHSSTTSDYSKGFGGRYGVERDKVDKAAVGFDYKSQAEKHDSQKGELGSPMQQPVSGLEFGTMQTGAVGHCAWFLQSAA